MKRLSFGREDAAVDGGGGSGSAEAMEVMLLLARAGVVVLGGDGGGRRTEDARPGRVFECSTCSRRFPSFQALGGHRASHHKRPRGGASRQAASAPAPSPATARMHGCAVCGVEFALGQALGGHMRRHRAEEKSGEARGSLLGLDLNAAPSSSAAVEPPDGLSLGSAHCRLPS